MLLFLLHNNASNLSNKESIALDSNLYVYISLSITEAGSRTRFYSKAREILTSILCVTFKPFCTEWCGTNSFTESISEV